MEDITKIIHQPGGYFIAPEGNERIGDVSNVVFSNGWIADDDGAVFIYYASADTRMHVVTTTIEKLLDYVMNTPEDGYTSFASSSTVNSIAEKNLSITEKKKEPVTG